MANQLTTEGQNGNPVEGVEVRPVSSGIAETAQRLWVRFMKPPSSIAPG